MRKYIVAALGLMLFCGCNLLPSGTPPEGNIVDNTFTPEKENYTIQQASDHLINSFTIAAMSVCPGEKIKIASSGDAIADNWSAWVVRQGGKITGNQLTSDDSAWVIASVIRGNVINVTLQHDGKEVWSESVNVVLK